jgi:hypothetical protein
MTNHRPIYFVNSIKTDIDPKGFTPFKPVQFNAEGFALVSVGDSVFLVNPIVADTYTKCTPNAYAGEGKPDAMFPDMNQVPPPPDPYPVEIPCEACKGAGVRCKAQVKDGDVDYYGARKLALLKQKYGSSSGDKKAMQAEMDALAKSIARSLDALSKKGLQEYGIDIRPFCK